MVLVREQEDVEMTEDDRNVPPNQNPRRALSPTGALPACLVRGAGAGRQRHQSEREVLRA